MDLAGLRREYKKLKLNKKNVSKDPIDQFNKWLQEAIDSKVMEPTAMTIATANAEGQPSTRNVLIKGVTDGCFVFYTNYDSAKGSDLAVNPKISISFYWPELERQIHIQGTVEKVAPDVSTDYFHTRPRNSQIGARISPQSKPIESRQTIMASFVKEAARWIAQTVKRPENWGGYKVTPFRIEFWQGRESRLHDRIEYKRQGVDWLIQRLAP